MLRELDFNYTPTKKGQLNQIDSTVQSFNSPVP